jgi:hypothetical protein
MQKLIDKNDVFSFGIVLLDNLKTQHFMIAQNGTLVMGKL